MRVDFQSEKLEQLLKKVPTFWEDSKIMRQLAAYGAFAIKERTARGVDYQEKEFAPYSVAYEELRRKKGRAVDKVNLLFKGKMLGAITTDARKGEGTIFFSSATESDKAYRHVAGLGNLPKREFFRLSRKDANFITDTLNKHIDTELEKNT